MSSSSSSPTEPASCKDDKVIALHKALRNDNLEQVQALLDQEDSSLLWQANSIGWTGMHVAASVGWSRDSWLLERSLIAPESLTQQKTTSEGYSSVQLFFKRHVTPLPWHDVATKRAAASLRRDLHVVAKDESLLKEFQTRVQQQTDIDDDSPVSRVVRFWFRMEKWLRAAYMHTLDTTTPLPVVHALAYTSCPSIEVVQLALKLVPHQSYDENGNLPLHVLAASSGRNVAFLQALLREHPQAASIPDSQGRLPLHIALSCQASPEFIALLCKAGPRVVLEGMRDAQTRLPSFALAATCSPNETSVQQWARCHQGNHDVGSLWHYLPARVRRDRLQQAERELDAVQVTTIYELLRSMPNAVCSGIDDNEEDDSV